LKKVKPAITIEDKDDLRKKIIHPIEKEEDLFNTYLPIRAPYQFYDYNGILLIASSGFLKLKDDDIYDLTIEEFEGYFDKRNFINPFTEESLLEDIANIRLTDEESIISFCNQYGLYGPTVTRNEFPPLLGDPLKIEVKEAHFVNLFERLDYFLENTTYLQEIIKIWYDEIPLLNEEYEKTNDESKLEELMNLKKGAVRFINRALRQVSPSINLRENGDCLPSYTSVSLLGAAYHQLNEAITQGKQFLHCLHCGSLFVPRKPNAKFCPPLQFGKHSSCQNSYNQMKNRARKAVHSGRKTIEEVANSIGRPLKEVRGWFN
jgi:hypothetical protein